MFLGVCLVGFGVSFFGFEALMANVYPIIGWVGLLTIAVLVAWWIKSRVRIQREAKYRERATELVNKFHEGEEELSDSESRELKKIVEKSNVGNYELAEALTSESHSESEDDSEEQSDSATEGAEDSASDKKGSTTEVENSTQELMDELEVDWEPGEDSDLKESKDS